METLLRFAVGPLRRSCCDLLQERHGFSHFRRECRIRDPALPLGCRVSGSQGTGGVRDPLLQPYAAGLPGTYRLCQNKAVMNPISLMLTLLRRRCVDLGHRTHMAGYACRIDHTDHVRCIGSSAGDIAHSCNVSFSPRMTRRWRRDVRLRSSFAHFGVCSIH